MLGRVCCGRPLVEPAEVVRSIFGRGGGGMCCKAGGRATLASSLEGVNEFCAVLAFSAGGGSYIGSDEPEPTVERGA